MAERDSTPNADEWALTPPEAPGQAIATGGPAGCSPSIARLATALAKAQGQIKGAIKDKTNPHYKSDYADLDSIWEACREPLSKNELAVLQPPSAFGPNVTVVTILAHSSGEWVRSELTMKAQTETPQAIGSAITYARRYALAAMAGVAPADDDGNEASGRNGAHASAPPDVAWVSVPGGPLPNPPAKYEEHWTDLTAAADEGTAAFDRAWAGMSGAFKNYTLEHRRAQRDALKVKAAVLSKAAKGTP